MFQTIYQIMINTLSSCYLVLCLYTIMIYTFDGLTSLYRGSASAARKPGAPWVCLAAASAAHALASQRGEGGGPSRDMGARTDEDIPLSAPWLGRPEKGPSK